MVTLCMWFEQKKEYTHYGKTTPPEDRFWGNTDKNGPIHPVYGQCWVWLGKPTIRGYGKLVVNYKRFDAHRYSYELNVGPITDGLCVLHKCDNPMCVRPDHLFLGTRTENMNDKVNKGRQTKGEDNAHKLTADAVMEIRRRYVRVNKVKSNAKELAAEFGVTPSAIIAVIKRRNWKHLE